MKYLLWAILFIGLVSCHEKKLSCEMEFPTSGRTLFCYLAGDNEFDDEVYTIIEQLRLSWNTKQGNLLILSENGKDKPALIQMQERCGRIVADTLFFYNNENAASPKLLRRAIEDVKRIAPSDNYGMLAISHATGWLPGFSFNDRVGWRPKARLQTRSMFVDKNDVMELSDFAAAIPDGTFDFMAFDLCFMASVETAYALRNKTKYLVASAAEILVPGFTYLYRENLPLLYEKTPKLEQYAQSFFDYYNAQTGQLKSATISIIDTEKMDDLMALMKGFSLRPLAQKELEGLQVYDQKDVPNLFFDYGQYMQKTLTASHYAKIEKLLQEIVIYKQNTDILISIEIKTHSGLSIYIPQESLPYLNEAYMQTEWARGLMNK